MAFRRKDNQQSEIEVKLCGLLPDATYEVTNADSGEVITATGADLMQSLKLKLEQPYSSLLLRYKKQ
jgi:alpha-galactosidase